MRYLKAPDKDFDVVILGGGIGGLATAAQLAQAGSRVCLVERHDTLGGYAHALNIDGFDFCYQVQYLMGCEEGGPMRRFLGRLGIADEIGFNFLDPDGYDIVVAPNLTFPIPRAEAFCERLCERYPESQAAIRRYFAISGRIWNEGRGYERILNWRDVAKAPHRHLSVLKHMRRTVSEIFDDLGLPPEVRLILAGQSGNLSAGPSEASFLMHCGMQEAYSRSAAYPKLGMRHFIASIAAVIENAPGCKVLRGCAVKSIAASGRRVDAIQTDDGRITAGTFISNLDPKATYGLIGSARGPELAYPYSDAVISLHLGFKDLDLSRHGFGRHNYWYHCQADIDREFDDLTRHHSYKAPWIFMSTPSLLADPGVLCDVGSSSLIMLTFINYEHIHALELQGGTATQDAMNEVESTFFDVLERFLPNAKRLATVRHLETPLDVQRRLQPAQGNVYGARLTPSVYNLRRVSTRSAYGNMHFANATAFYPGVMPIIVGSMQLVDELTRSSGDGSQGWHTAQTA